jgi:hypothetical protein
MYSSKLGGLTIDMSRNGMIKRTQEMNATDWKDFQWEALFGMPRQSYQTSWYL